MKLKSFTDGILVGITRSEGKERPVYKISLMVGEEAGTLYTTEEVFNLFSAEKLKLFSTYRYTVSFDTNGGYARIVGVDEL